MLFNPSLTDSTGWPGGVGGVPGSGGLWYMGGEDAAVEVTAGVDVAVGDVAGVTGTGVVLGVVKPA